MILITDSNIYYSYTTVIFSIMVRWVAWSFVRVNQIKEYQGLIRLIKL